MSDLMKLARAWVEPEEQTPTHAVMAVKMVNGALRAFPWCTALAKGGPPLAGHFGCFDPDLATCEDCRRIAAEAKANASAFGNRLRLTGPTHSDWSREDD